MLQDRLLHALAVRPEHRSLMALTFIDLDGFKAINDRFSHAAGDCVLEVVATRIQQAVRARDTVARWGGDEFLVLHEGLLDESDGQEIARRIWAAVAEPIHCLGQEISVTTSLGTAFCRPADRIDAADLLRRADAAMYEVKRTGRNGCATFDW
jgi:diguanylate cyclase (GGDEF)-like protein